MSSGTVLTTAGLEFLTECAQARTMTSYSELNAELVTWAGLAGFDFQRPDERAAMGHLLALIVERSIPATGLMLSALVQYLGGNDAGIGFFGLAVDLGLLPDGASRTVKDELWGRSPRSTATTHPRRYPRTEPGTSCPGRGLVIAGALTLIAQIRRTPEWTSPQWCKRRGVTRTCRSAQ